MDDITNLVEEQRDLITNQTNTIERQNHTVQDSQKSEEKCPGVL